MHTKKTNNTNKLMQISYHSALTKIQKLQNLKKKKTFFCTDRYCPKLVGTVGIFSGTKHGSYMYRIACRYGIFQRYRPVRYRIDSLVTFSAKVCFSSLVEKWCIGWYAWYSFGYETGGLYILVYLPVWYIPAVPAGTVRNR